jgi:transcriptional regulator with GAF, ATPase, and Fis domain
MPDNPPAAPGSPGGVGAEESLIRLATEIAGYNTIAELLDHLPGHLRPLFAFDGVGIVLHDPATNEVNLSLSFGTPDFMPGGKRRPVHFGPAGWVFQSQQPRFDTLTPETTHPTLGWMYNAGYRSALWLPLSTSRTRLGTFVGVRKTTEPIAPDYHRLIQWAANIVALALEHLTQVEALERLRHQVADERDRARGALYDLGERVKELTALHHTARLLEDEQLGVAELLQKIAMLLPPAFQFPDVTEARVFYGATVVRTPGFVETPWTLSQTFVTGDGTTGGLDVVYLQERPPSVEGPFLREERHLIDSLADMVTSALDKRGADAALRESEDHLRQARDRARLLLDITNAVVSELDLRRLLDVISKLVAEKIPHHFASIGLWEADEQRLRRHALVFSSQHGNLVEEGRLVAVGSPGDVAFRRGQTTLFNWNDILALGEPSVSVMAVEGLRSACCVPLKTARGAYGVLNVGKPEDDAFAPDEVELLEEVARQLAIAFENALSFRQAERYRQESLAQRDRLQLLLDVNNQLLAQPESYTKRLSVLSMARRFVELDYAALIIWNAESKELCIEANTYYDSRGVMEPRQSLPLKASPSGIAFSEQRVRTFTGAEIEQFDRDSIKALAYEGMKSVCSVPLITQRGTLGTLTVGRRDPDGFSASEVSLLGDVAGQVAIAVANTLAYQEISALKDRLTEEKLYLEDEISMQHDFKQIVGTSPALTSVLRQIRTVAPTDATVLLLGETGTGKELLARALHDASKRRAQTFVRVNGAELHANLNEIELLGYVKCAFSVAVSS